LKTEAPARALDETLDAAAATLPPDDPDAERHLWAAVSLALDDDPRHAAAVPAEFGLDRPPPAELLERIARARADGTLTPATAGAAFERRQAARTDVARRDNGVYFTRADLARFVVDRALAPLLDAAASLDDLLAITVCDPAAGAGAFALPAVDALAERAVELCHRELHPAQARRLVVEHCVHLVDVDPLAVALLRGLLRVHVGAGAAEAVARRVVQGDAVLGPPPWRDAAGPSGLDWARAFPEAMANGGFGAVVGNPPWGTVKPAHREWFGARDDRVGGLQGAALHEHLLREHGAALDAWRAHRSGRLAYAAALRDDCGYRHQGPGDTDFYRYFLERSHQLLRPGGRLGVVVPSALLRAEGSAPLRRLLFADGTAELVLDFLNRRRIFAIHGMFRFLVLVWQQGAANGVARAAFGLGDVGEARAAASRAPLRLDVPYLRRVSGGRLSVPDVRTPEQVALLGRLSARHPALGERAGTGWQVRFARELDMTNDARHFVDVDRARAAGATPTADGSWAHPRLGPLLPVYEGRMVHQFDASAKRYLGGHGRGARWEPLAPADKALLPHYLVPEEIARARGVPAAARAGFCDITGHANERTALAALIPGAAACGNKVPTCRFDSAAPGLPLLWLALANSFVVDWIVRRRVSTTLNFFHWEQVPVPRLDPATGAGAELVHLAAALCESPFAPWAPGALERRAGLRAAIDAVVAEAYGLDARDLTVVLADFPLLDRGGAGTSTRDLVLLASSRRAGTRAPRLSDVGLPTDGGPDDIAERVADAGASGRIAYVPGELAAHLRARDAT
jgi:hypothetical protein